MHEWALAESVVLAVSNEAKKNGLKRIKRVVLKVGELQKLEKEIFFLAIEALFLEQGYEIKRGNVHIRDEEASLRCNICEKEWPYSSSLNFISEEERELIHFLPEVIHSFIKCPYCGSRDFELEKGRGVVIEEIVGES